MDRGTRLPGLWSELEEKGECEDAHELRTIQEEKVRRRSPAPPAPSSVRALPRSRPPKIRSLAGPGVEAGGVPCPAPGQLDCPRSPDLACCDECYIVGMSRKLLKIHKTQHQ